jgi:hypothetical protein
MDSKQAEKLSKAGLSQDDRDVMAKKNFTVEDIKDALTENTTSSDGRVGGNIVRTGAILVFCLLLVASGIGTIFLTSLTVFGIIVGALMILAGVIIPFVALGRS